MQQSDEALARAAIQGDREAFGVLVQRLRSPLIGYLTGLLARRDEAEELAQETLMLAWQKIGTLRYPGRIGAWVFQIGHNLAVRRRSQIPTLPLEIEPPGRANSDGEDPRLIALLRAVARLSEAHRDVIARKHFGGASGQMIAEQLGIAPGTVRSRLSRAYAELREILANELQREA